MADDVRILAFAGSARTGSLNRRALALAAAGARAGGAEVTLLDLRELSLPLYDGDLEAASGLPAGAVELKRLMVAHHGLLLACPEYNSSVTPLLKNAIDWASRPAQAGEAPLIAFRGKVAALLSASPGALGGLRGLAAVRSILGNIGVLVLPDQVAVPRAQEVLGTDGAPADDAQRGRLEGLGRRLAEVTRALRA